MQIANFDINPKTVTAANPRTEPETEVALEKEMQATPQQPSQDPTPTGRNLLAYLLQLCQTTAERNSSSHIAPTLLLWSQAKLFQTKSNSICTATLSSYQNLPLALSSICSLTTNRKFGEQDLPSKIPSHSMSSSTTTSLSPTLEPQSSRPSSTSKEN